MRRNGRFSTFAIVGMTALVCAAVAPRSDSVVVEVVTQQGAMVGTRSVARGRRLNVTAPFALSIDYVVPSASSFGNRSTTWTSEDLRDVDRVRVVLVADTVQDGQRMLIRSDDHITPLALAWPHPRLAPMIVVAVPAPRPISTVTLPAVTISTSTAPTTDATRRARADTAIRVHADAKPVATVIPAWVVRAQQLLVPAVAAPVRVVVAPKVAVSPPVTRAVSTPIPTPAPKPVASIEVPPAVVPQVTAPVTVPVPRTPLARDSVRRAPPGRVSLGDIFSPRSNPEPHAVPRSEQAAAAPPRPRVAPPKAAEPKATVAPRPVPAPIMPPVAPTPIAVPPSDPPVAALAALTTLHASTVRTADVDGVVTASLGAAVVGTAPFVTYRIERGLGSHVTLMAEGALRTGPVNGLTDSAATRATQMIAGGMRYAFRAHGATPYVSMQVGAAIVPSGTILRADATLGFLAPITSELGLDLGVRPFGREGTRTLTAGGLIAMRWTFPRSTALEEHD